MFGLFRHTKREKYSDNTLYRVYSSFRKMNGETFAFYHNDEPLIPESMIKKTKKRIDKIYKNDCQYEGTYFQEVYKS